jgi:hypothetical protein
VSAPTEALGLVPNLDWRPRERFDIRPHGTEARARRERRQGRKPCPACLAAERAAHNYREALRGGHALRTRPGGARTVTPEYVTEVWCPPADSGVHALHSPMREPEPLPEPEPEAEL